MGILEALQWAVLVLWQFILFAFGIGIICFVIWCIVESRKLNKNSPSKEVKITKDNMKFYNN